jgi:endonuclease-3
MNQSAQPSNAPCRAATVLARLSAQYGPFIWHQHNQPVDELISTILSQHTSDINTERAFRSLKKRFPDWDDVVEAPTSDVADAIRSGGLANIKAPRIQAVLRSIRRQFGSFNLDHLSAVTVSEARAELVELNGVGPKTASCVLLFSFGKPAMPVDTHVHRVARRVGLIGETVSAEDAHELLESQLGENVNDVYAFHLSVIAHGRSVCIARRPRCDRCPLTDCCDYFARLQIESAGA